MRLGGVSMYSMPPGLTNAIDRDILNGNLADKRSVTFRHASNVWEPAESLARSSRKAPLDRGIFTITHGLESWRLARMSQRNRSSEFLQGIDQFLRARRRLGRAGKDIAGVNRFAVVLLVGLVARCNDRSF